MPFRFDLYYNGRFVYRLDPTDHDMPGQYSYTIYYFVVFSAKVYALKNSVSDPDPRFF